MTAIKLVLTMLVHAYVSAGLMDAHFEAEPCMAGFQGLDAIPLIGVDDARYSQGHGIARTGGICHPRGQSLQYLLLGPGNTQSACIMHHAGCAARK